nr:metal ABC transporter permease [Kineosphaera limosa]
MRRALLAALLVGIAAPLVGVFLVQRGLSLVGDGIGHVAFAGVAVGLVTQSSPIWVALLFAAAGGIIIELVRANGRTNGDVALALMFYGGIALGVVVISAAPRAGTTMTSYLFGAITTTTAADLAVFAALTLGVLAVTGVLRARLFAVANDPEYARAAGLPVLALNITLSVLTAVTVVVSMRVVGLLLISALMIVPTATAQLLARSFRATTVIAVLIGVLCSVGGVAASFTLQTPSGGTIVLGAIAIFAVVAAVDTVRRRVAGRRDARHGHDGPGQHRHAHQHGDGCGHEVVEHDGHRDYLHDGHLHSPHGDHYDEHDIRSGRIEPVGATTGAQPVVSAPVRREQGAPAAPNRAAGPADGEQEVR